MDITNIVIILAILVILFLALKYQQLTENLAMKNYDNLQNGSVEASIGVDEKTRAEASIAISMILKNINVRSKAIYVLSRVQNITVELLSCGSTHYIVDAFVHELRYKITRRILVDFMIKPNHSVIILSMNISNAFKYPDSTETSNSTVTPDLILMDLNLMNDYHIEGVDNGTIPFTLLEHPMPKDTPVADSFRNWILPMGIQTDYISNCPARRQSKWWDANGVPISGGDNLASPPRGGAPDSGPEFNPTINMSLTDVDGDSWLFNKADGVMGRIPVQ